MTEAGRPTQRSTKTAGPPASPPCFLQRFTRLAFRAAGNAADRLSRLAALPGSSPATRGSGGAASPTHEASGVFCAAGGGRYRRDRLRRKGSEPRAEQRLRSLQRLCFAASPEGAGAPSIPPSTQGLTGE